MTGDAAGTGEARPAAAAALVPAPALLQRSAIMACSCAGTGPPSTSCSSPVLAARAVTMTAAASGLATSARSTLSCVLVLRAAPRAPVRLEAGKTG
jgi:hypothetical protein